jgi:hypothetical protein
VFKAQSYRGNYKITIYYINKNPKEQQINGEHDNKNNPTERSKTRLIKHEKSE